MTSRERLLTALAGQQPDRVPIAFHGVYPYIVGEDWRCKHPSYAPLLALAREETDPWCWWGLDAGTFYTVVPTHKRPLDGDFVETVVETPLGPISEIENTIQQVRKAYLQNDEDIQRFLSIRYEPARPDLAPAWELERTVGERGLLYTGGLDALGIVADLFTPEDFAIRCHYSQTLILRLIEKVFEYHYDYVHYMLDHGPRSLWSFGGAEYATAPLLAPRYFDAFVVPYTGRLVELIHRHGGLVEIHCHGRLNGILERIVDMGPDALHPIETPPMGDVTLAEAKRRLGRICIIGNIQIGDMIALTPEEIDRSVREAVRDGGPGGLVLSTSASPYEPELGARTLANFRQMVASGRKYGVNKETQA